MLQISDNANISKKKQVNGEVCEVVLRVLTEHYFQTSKVKGVYLNSVILEDVSNPKSSFCTEVDSLILTPMFCLCGECKSYTGDITIKGDCTLSRPSYDFDVYKQSVLHGKILRQHLQKFVLPGVDRNKPPFAMFCFLYSKGSVKDLRTKKPLPVLNLTKLYSYYDHIYKVYRKEVYNFEAMVKHFKKCAESEELRKKHKAFLGY